MLWLINLSIWVAINYHNVLCGLWVVQGMATASLKSNILQKITSMREEVIYKVLLDLREDYYVINR